MLNKLSLFWDRFKKFKLFLGKKVWRFFTVTVFFGLFWFIVDLSFIYVIQIFLISLGLFEQDRTLISNQFNLKPINGVFFLCVFGLLRSLLLAARSYVSGMLAQEFAIDHRRRIMNIALLNENHRSSSAETLALFGDRIGGACNFVTSGGQLIITGIATCLYFGMGIYFSPTVFLIGVFIFAILLVPLKYLNSRIETAGRGITETSISAYNTLIFGIRNIFFLRMTDMQEVEFKKGIQSLDKNYSNYKKYYAFGSIKNGAPIFIGTLVISFLTYLGIVFFKTPGIQLISIFYVFIRLGQMAGDSNSFISELRFHYPSLMTLYNFFNQHELIPINEAASKQHQFQEINSIKLDNISFQYPSQKVIFDSVSLEVKKDNILLIKGPSGVGKSTLLSVIVGLLSPSKGQVAINGINIVKLKTNLPQLIGYVGPDPFIIPGTVKENLHYGITGRTYSDSEVHNALGDAECLDFIQNLQGGLDHYLSELTPLSTGQKQRLALARTLLRKPQIYIFDEATANLDHVTEGKIISLVSRISQNAIVLIISHKDTFDEISDIRLNLSAGSHELNFKS